jgi:hypothetical protein
MPFQQPEATTKPPTVAARFYEKISIAAIKVDSTI